MAGRTISKLVGQHHHFACRLRTAHASIESVERDISNILSKLGVASRTEAVALALRHKLVN